VTVEGSGFGSTQGEGFIQVGDRNGQVLSWSDTKIVATVDPWARPAVVSVNQNRMNSNNIPFGISAPVIQGMTPIALEAGKQATIRGSGFGSTQGNGYVQTANTRATIVDWGDTRIVITVPPGTTNGHLYVHQSGVDSHPINLYMAAQ
jgi:hypothetical protein